MQFAKKKKRRRIPSGTKQGRIDQVGPVCCANDENLAAGARVCAVQLGEQLRHDAVHHATRVALIATVGRERVEFIEENHARLGVSLKKKHRG